MAKAAAATIQLALVAFSLIASAAPPGAIRYVQQLSEDDWILKAEALHYLAENKIQVALDPILSLVKDTTEEPWTRSRALIAYCKLQSGESLPEIVSTFASMPDTKLREGAAKALEFYSDTTSKTLADKLIKDAEPSVQFLALASYSRIGKDQAWPLVDKMTQDVTGKSVPMAGRALALIGTDKALLRLSDLCKKIPATRALIQALSDIENPKLIPVFLEMLEQTKPDEENFQSIISALEKHEDNALSLAIRSSIKTGRDSALFVCSRIITLLLQDPQLGEPLRVALDKAESLGTLEAGLIALGSREMNPDTHQEFFVRFLKHTEPDLRTLSIRCLSHCKEANLYDLLSETIRDEEDRVSIAAMNALLQAPLDQAPTGQLVSYLEHVLVSTDDAIRKMGFEVLAYAGNADDFEPALAMLGEALSGTDTRRREAVAEALGSIAPDNGIANVARRQGYVSNWMVVGTFLNDKDHKAFVEELAPENKIDFEETYPSTYVWALQGNQRKAGDKPIEREIGWAEASVNKTNGMLRLGPLLPPPGTFSIAYAVADFTSNEEKELLLSVDGDDAFRVWLNDEKVAEEIAPYVHRQSCLVARPNIAVKVKSGENRILVKSANIENEWWVRVRITDKNNKPVEIFK